MHFWKEKHYPHPCQYIELILIRGSVCGQLDGQSGKKGSYEKNRQGKDDVGEAAAQRISSESRNC
jgi:hypothetical protein